MPGILGKIAQFFSKEKPVEKKKRERVSLWDRFPSWKEYNAELERLLIERATRDLERGDVRKAIDRYEGFFKHYPENQRIHNRVAELYLKVGNKQKAGRHWYFKEQLTEVEQECVEAFKKWCGDSTRTVKYLIYKQNYKYEKLDDHTQKKFRELVKKSAEELGTIPNFLKPYDRHFTKLDKEGKNDL